MHTLTPAMIDGPTISSLVNLLVAVGTAVVAVFGAAWKVRKWQKDDMTNIVRAEVSPIMAQQKTILKEQEMLVAEVRKISGVVSGHESRISYIEGKEAARAEFRGAAPPVELTDSEGGAR